MPEAISPTISPSQTSPSPTQHLHPVLLTFADLTSNSVLAAQLADFINICFHNSHARFPASWSTDLKRFETNQELLDMLGEQGVFCVVYDEDEDLESEESGSGSGGQVRCELTNGATSRDTKSRAQKIVACAAAVPWTTSTKDTAVAAPAGTALESGWEIKTVCVDSGARYAKTGLAGRMEDMLARYLLQLENGKNISEGSSVTLWVIAAETLRGPYWRRRGYVDVRRGVAKKGTWGCKEEFEMIVLKKDVGIGALN